MNQNVGTQSTDWNEIYQSTKQYVEKPWGYWIPQNSKGVKIKRNLKNVSKFLKNASHFKAMNFRILRLVQISQCVHNDLEECTWA